MSKGKLNLKKETITVLNEAEMDQANGGAARTTWACVYGSVVLVSGIVTSIHDTGDKKSWWHCTEATEYKSCKCEEGN